MYNVKKYNWVPYARPALLTVNIMDLDSIVNNKIIMPVKDIKLQGEVVQNPGNLDKKNSNSYKMILTDLNQENKI